MKKIELPFYLFSYLRRRLFQVIFHVTYRCNAKCNFCINAPNLNKNTSSEMNVSEIERMARNLPEFPWLLISGGEPFLREDLSEIVEIFHDINHIRLLSLPTNGMFPEKVKTTTQKILDQCPNLAVNLDFSLDGLRNRHDKIRGVEEGFEKVIETFSLLKDIRVDNPKLALKFETVVSKQNYQNLEEIIEFVYSLGPDNHVCDLARGDLSHPCKYLPDIDEINRIYRYLQKISESYRGKNSAILQSNSLERIYRNVTNAYWGITLRTLREKRRIIPCYAGKVSAVIYPNGDLSFCEMLPSIGNLREECFEFFELWYNQCAQKLRKEIVEEACYCFHPCNQLINILFNPVELVKATIGSK